MATPQWNARHNGLLGDASAMANAADVNQLLGTHAQAEIHQGAPILTPTGSGASITQPLLSAVDIDQPFVLSGTSIGRVQIPLLPTGNGADLLVSLCANNGGTPGNLVEQVRIPAAWIAQLAAAEGLDSAGPVTIAANNALRFSGWQSVPWSPPATGPTGGLGTAQMAQSGSYMVFAGGVNASSGAATATVAVITWTGGNAVSSPVPGPALPQALQSGGLAVTTDSLCYVGGASSANAAQSTVYLASWDPSTAAIGTWSLQTNFPTTIVFPGIAAYAPTDTVYVAGGSTNYAPATNIVSSVYYATITSGQITGWTAAPPFPAAIADPSVAVIGDYLIVAGGFLASGNGSPGIYYTPLNTTTGAPGQWYPVPPIPTGLGINTQGTPAFSDTGIVWVQTFGTSSGFPVQDTLTLTWTPSGPGIWVHQVSPLAVLNQDQVTALMAAGDGSYQAFNFQDTAYLTAEVVTVPMISVPLPVTGLSNGTTYHLLLQQIGGDENDYLSTFLDSAVFSGNPTALSSARLAYNWTAVGAAGTAVPVQIFNNSAPPPGVLPLHTWDDSGARITTLVNNTTPDLALIGLCEATVMVTAANENTGAANTLAPWVATGGTLARSQAEVFEGLWAFQLTPDGVSSNSYMQSEFLNCLPGQSITISGWVWCTAAVTSDFSLSINWYTNGSVLINTSSNVISIPGATWTFVTNTFTATTSGGGAYRYTLNPTLSGTQAASNVTYFDLVIGYPTYTGEQLSGVAQVVYPGTVWPEINPLKPTGTVVLA